MTVSRSGEVFTRHGTSPIRYSLLLVRLPEIAKRVSKPERRLEQE